MKSATSASQVMAPNGMVVSTEKLSEIRSKLLQLERESHFELGELIRVSRNPYYSLHSETREILISRGFLNIDGSNNFLNQNIIQYLYRGDGYHLELITFDDMLETFTVVMPGADIE